MNKLFASMLLAVIVSACGGGGGEESTPVMPGVTRVPINTGTGWSDSPYISRDGRRLYFMYSRYNFGPWILSNRVTPPVVSGPDRPGLHKSSVNAFHESDIYVATKNADGTWSEPVNMGFNGAFGDSSGMEFDNGNGFVWLRGDGTTNNIVVATRNQDGSWNAPVDLGSAINDHSTSVFQDNPHISPDGNFLWFTSNRPNGVGGTDIWFSSKSNGTWSAPVNVGALINSSSDDDQIWISPVAGNNDVYWNGPQGIMHCVSNGATCGNTPTALTFQGCDFAAEASLPDDGQTMYFACSSAATGMIRIVYSIKQANGSWGPAIPVD